MKNLVLVSILFILSISLNAQDPVALKFANKIDSLKMKQTVTKLSSDEFKGRKSSEEGAVLAANYLINQLSKAKITPGNKGTYKQNIHAYTQSKANKYFKYDGFSYKKDYNYKNEAWQDSVISGKKIVFANYGVHHSTYTDFKNIDLKDKTVMVISGKGPINKYGVPCHKAYNIPNIKFISSQKPKALFIVKQGFSGYSNYASKKLVFSDSKSENSVPKIYINELLANKLLSTSEKTIKQLIYESEKTCEPNTFEFENEFTFNGNLSYKIADANNIVAVIEGSDLKIEYVVLSAHYDHIGKSSYSKKVYHGADDNASGVAAVMEIARVLQQAKKAKKGPRRTIVVVLFTAEEDGLKGSGYYVENPIYPLEKTIACVNIDMVGRIGSKLEEIDIKKGYIYALTGKSKPNYKLFNIPDSISSATSKMQIIEKDGSYYSSVFRRSDHYSFYKENIPSILFTGGSHKDLHKYTDIVEKINFPLMEKRTKLAFLTIWDLANKTTPFKIDKPLKIEKLKIVDEEVDMEVEEDINN